MPSGQVIRVTQADDAVAAASLRAGIQQLQNELEVTPQFPPEVSAEAAAVAGTPGREATREDRTDLPFITLDPAGSMDLDQALHLARTTDGYVVDYAIADVHAFVAPGGPIDTEAHRRGESLYGADSKIPLHPVELSEGAASLLPDEVRPVLLWTSTLDAAGQILDTRVRRATIRSVAKLDYVGLQAALDGGTLSGPYADSVGLLPEIGKLRIDAEIARGGIDLPLPDQEIEVAGEQWRLAYRSQLPVERWNAQLSLLTGFGAAAIMLQHKVGLLRTLPPSDPRDVARLRRTAQALGIDWPADQAVPDFIRSLDPSHSRHAAMVVASTRLLRGSGYTAFNGTLPELTEHAALASPYAHVTAPLRRLIDRYAGEVCVALCAGEQVPAWVLEKFETLPETMQASGRKAGAYERGILDLVEAGILAPQIGSTFEGVVVEVSEKDQTRGNLSLHDPAVEAGLTSTTALPLGDPVTATLTEADIATRKVAFRLG
ncbi:RNB domain-containing ribonuclease [Nocardioides sp.]|uniref:RNB domain-containing ribonuclease n=1 Tax=Nocardioides sp. TaxID=35761 RepID=UPI00260F1BF3|nr:RNB domain-containing ribonuclease [Nocardioides sp.]